MSDAEIPEVSVFVGNFGKDDVTESRLEELFEDKNLRIKRIDMKRGFAFVYILAERSDVQDAVSAMHGSTTIEGGSNILRIEIASGANKSKENRRKNLEPTETLFVVNFLPTTTEEDLRSTFSKYGDITRCSLRNNFAFIGFKSVEEATEARKGTNNQNIFGRQLSVEYAERKPQRMGYGGPGGYRDGPGGYRDGPRGGCGDRGGYGGPPPRGGGYGYDRGPPPRDYYDRGPPPRDWDRGRDRYDDRGPPRDYDRRDDRGRGGGYDDRGYDRGGRDYDRGPPPPRRDDRGRGYDGPGRDYDRPPQGRGERERSRERESPRGYSNGNGGGGDERFRE